MGLRRIAPLACLVDKASGRLQVCSIVEMRLRHFGDETAGKILGFSAEPGLVFHLCAGVIGVTRQVLSFQKQKKNKTALRIWPAWVSCTRRYEGSGLGLT